VLKESVTPTRTSPTAPSSSRQVLSGRAATPPDCRCGRPRLSGYRHRALAPTSQSSRSPRPSSSAMAEFFAQRRGEHRRAITFFRRARRPELHRHRLELRHHFTELPVLRRCCRARKQVARRAAATDRRPLLFGLHHRTPPSIRATSNQRRAERRHQARTVCCPLSTLAAPLRALLAPLIVVTLSSSLMCRCRSACSHCRATEWASPRFGHALAAPMAQPLGQTCPLAGAVLPPLPGRRGQALHTSPSCFRLLR
jgi:hypothetical protein